MIPITNSIVRRLRRRALKFFFGEEQSVFVRNAVKEYNLLQEHDSMNLVETFAKQHSDIYQHLVTLNMLTVEFNLKTVLELGTRSGVSTVTLLEAVHQIGGHVYSVDIEPCPDAKKIVEKHNLGSRWTFTETDDLNLEWNQPIDHLFIDTSHEFEHTVKELEKFEPFVKVGGIITLHDALSCPPVMKAIKQHISKRPDLKLYTYLNNNGLAIIFKKQK